MPYHVVCHDCPTERVFDTEVAAVVLVDSHTDAYDHDIEYEQVDDDDR